MYRKISKPLVALLLALTLAFPWHAGAFDGGAGFQALAAGQGISGIDIKDVQVIYGGNVQERYRSAQSGYNVSRNTVYGDGGAWYTTAREGVLSDPRIFTLEFTVDSADYLGIGNGTGQFDPSRLQWRYDGKALPSSGLGGSYGSTRDGIAFMRIEPGSTAAALDGDDIVVTAKLRIGAYQDNIRTNSSRNVPYNPYYVYDGGTTEAMLASIGDVRNGGNRDKELTVYYSAVSDSSLLASTVLRTNVYDSYHTWEELAAFAQDQGRLYPSGKPEKPGRFLGFESVGQSTQEREMWTAVISDSEASIDEYLNVTRQNMTDDPSAVSLDAKVPLYFSSIHAREVIGPDITMEIIDRLMTEDTLKSSRLVDDPSKYNRVLPSSPGAYSNRGWREIGIPNDSPGAVGVGKFNNDSYYEDVNVDVDELLSKYIIVMTFTTNPDGRDVAQRTNYYEYDMNRDASYMSQKETKAVAAAFGRWDPLTMIEFHGYYDTFMIDACTPPHEPNFEYDLFRKNDLTVRIADSLGRGFIGKNTPYNKYTVPTRDVLYQWDDGTTIFTPTLAMLYGAYSSTIEFPASCQDSIDAGVAGVYSFFDFCINNKAEMLANKLEWKYRGVNNIDHPDVDEYLVTVDPLIEELGFAWVGKAEKVGRPRTGQNSFFPEYFVIPVDPANQKNVPAAVEMVQALANMNVKIEKSTAQVAYGGVSYPAGSYVVNMHQGNRNVANALLYEGYDASIYARLYSNMVVNHPDMRGFDCVKVYEPGIFKGKTQVDKDPGKPASSIPGWGTYVIVKNNSADAARLINRLLADGKEAWMIKAANNLAKAGDFVVKRADLGAGLAPAKNIILGNLPLYADCTAAGDFLPVNAVPVTKPYVGIYGNAYELNMQYFLDLYEFEDVYDIYEEWDESEDVNVVLAYYGRSSATEVINNWIADWVRREQLPFIACGGNAGRSTANTVLGTTNAATNPISFGYMSSGEALLRGTYAPNSIVAAGFDGQETMYTNSGMYINALPSYLTPIATVTSGGDYFKAGWWYSASGLEQAKLQGKTMAASGVFDNGGKPLSMTVLADYVFDKGQAQLNYRLVSNSLFAYASGIADRQPSEGDDPVPVPLASVVAGNGQANVNFDIRSANGKGYTVYLSDTGNPGSFAPYSNVNYNSGGAHVKGLVNGKTYYAYVEYNNGAYVERSCIAVFTPTK